MQFAIIYSVDVPESVNVMDHAPPQVQELWSQTESGPTEYDYLEGDWKKGRHKKWTALLNREQFDDFVERCGLTADSTPTMGSLGAPGFGCGWAPAISFTGDSQECIANAYVTPIPEVKRTEFEENDWERVRDAVLAVYG